MSPSPSPDDLGHRQRQPHLRFNDASSKSHQPTTSSTCSRGRPHGRLLRYDPSTGKTEVLLKDL